MRYMPDPTIPTNLKTRQEIADNQHSPHANVHPAMYCLSAGDCFRMDLRQDGLWLQHIGERGSNNDDQR